MKKITLKLLTIVFLVTLVDGAAHAREILHQVPNSSSQIVACTPAYIETKLDLCVNQLIELPRASGDTLKIQLAAGTYILSGTFMFYGQTGVTLEGAGNTTTKLKWSDSFRPAQKLDLYYFFNLINSKQITLKNFQIDGMNLPSQRAIGLCGLEKFAVSDIRIEGLLGKNVVGYFLISGNAYNEDYLTKIANRLDWTLSGGAGQARMMQDLQNKTVATYCGGGISNVSFLRNEMHLLNVGFYLDPYAQKQSLGKPISTRNWLTVLNETTQLNQNINVESNVFKIADKGVHSAIKITNVRKLNILDNTVDSESYPDSFYGGAAINIANGVQSAMVANNRILFPAAHLYPHQGIALNSHFERHPWYGIGTLQVATPALGITVTKNAFRNTGISIHDCCTQDFANFCNDMDANQYFFLPKYDRLKINLNTRNNQSLPNRSLTHIISRDETGGWVRALHCRKRLGVEF